MNTMKESGFEVINQDVKAILIKLNELIAASDGDLDPDKLAKNNEAFLELLDRLNELKTIMQRD